MIDDTSPLNNSPEDDVAQTSEEMPSNEPQLKDIENASGPMTSMLYDPQNEITNPVTFDDKKDPRMPNRASRRAAKKKGIGREYIKRQTQERVEASNRDKAVRELPEDVRNLIEKITSPEVIARTKDTPLHQWSREDALDMFFTLGHVHAKMMCPIPADENEVAPPAVRLIQAGPSVGVFYPVTDDSQSHILVTVHDPRHYMSGAERDLTNDTALFALSSCAEQIVTGVYSLAGSLMPGSDAREIADLMIQLNDMNPEV